MRYAHGGDVTYLDVGRVFMKDGRLNRDLFADPKMTPPQVPLHPSAEGQALMAEANEAYRRGDEARQNFTLL